MNSKLSSSSNRSQAWAIRDVPWVAEVPTMVFGFALSRGKFLGGKLHLVYHCGPTSVYFACALGYGQTCRTTVAGAVWLGNTEIAHAEAVHRQNIDVVESRTMKKISMVRAENINKNRVHRLCHTPCTYCRIHYYVTHADLTAYL